MTSTSCSPSWKRSTRPCWTRSRRSTRTSSTRRQASIRTVRAETMDSMPTGPQTQSATQINSTIQIVASSLLSDLGAAGGAGSSAAEALNQTLQGIWQLQIGCVFDCFLTQQTQQAEQSNMTIYVQPDPPATTTSTANTTMSLIWQLQVGCLFWCYDAVEVQTATSSSTTLVVVPVPPTPPVGSGGTGQPSPASTSPVSATGVTLATTISAPPLNPIVAPPAAPIVASARSAPAPLKVALEPLNAVLSAAIAQPSYSAVSAAANTRSCCRPDRRGRCRGRLEPDPALYGARGIAQGPPASNHDP